MNLYRKRSLFLSYILLMSILGSSYPLFSQDDPFFEARKRMVEYDLKGRDITDPNILNAMLRVKRHLFVDKSQWK